MPQPTVTLTKNADNTYSTVYPNGDKPIATLGYKNITNEGVTPTQGDYVAFSSNSFDFGNDIPKLLYRLSLNGASAGVLTDINSVIDSSIHTKSVAQNNGNSGTDDGKFKIQARAAMPYGYALAIGQPVNESATGAASLKIEAQALSSKSFRTACYEFPAANQAEYAARVQVSSDAGWGIKPFWDTYITGSSTNGLNIDVYTGLIKISGSQPNVAAVKENLCNSNDPGMTHSNPISTNTTSALDPADATKWRTVPMIQQHYIEIASSGTVQAKLIDTSVGVLYNFSNARVDTNTAVASNVNQFDTHYLNGQCNGFFVDVGANFYLGDISQYYGDAAPLRIEISDSASATSHGPVSVCDMVYAGGDTVIIKIEKGFFWQESLAGKYFRAWDSDNQFLGAQVIV